MPDPIYFILDFAIRVFALFCLLRFLLQLAGANFYSPIVNSIQKFTNPVLHPLRRLLPRSTRIDLASLIAVWLLHSFTVFLQLLQNNVLSTGAIPLMFWQGLISALHITVWVYMVGILVSVVMSWFAPNTYSPAAELSKQLTEPYLYPFRKFLPPLAGFDFSPMLGILVLVLINSYIIPSLSVL